MIDPKLKQLIPEEGFVLITGDIRSGKSCLGYGLLAELAADRGKPAYVFGLPKEKHHLLPSTIKPLDDMEFPDDSIVLADEAYMGFYARESAKAANKFMDVFAGLVGQKGILGIYITQQSRKLDIGIVSSARVLLMKRPSLLQMKLERPSLRPLFAEAADAFDKQACPESCTYVFSGDCIDMILQSNSPPSFWSEELSKAYKGVSLTGKPPEPKPIEVLDSATDGLLADLTESQVKTNILLYAEANGLKVNEKRRDGLDGFVRRIKTANRCPVDKTRFSCPCDDAASCLCSLFGA